MGKKVAYKIQIKNGQLQTFHVSEERMMKVREKYDDNQVNSYVSFSNKRLDSLLIKADTIEQANLLLDIWGMPQVFATTNPIQ